MIAGAINFIGGETLFGRHWGAIEHHPFLHFEICYYQAIDFAIDRKLKRVEAGAQGEHKLARGYLPVTTHSAHFIADPGLRRAIAEYLVRERAMRNPLAMSLRPRSILFLLGQILAERRQRRKLLAGGFHIGALADQIVGDRPAQPGIGDVMGRMGGHRQIAARELVLALGAGLDALELAVDGELDGLVIADLEMQERVVLDRAPVAAEQRVARR